MFIDFLNLENKYLWNTNLVIFYWKSWSGKSTYLKYFMNKNKNQYEFLFHKDKKIIFKKYEKEYIFIDEIVNLHWLYIVYKYLSDWKKLFIATHIHPIIYKILFWLFYKWNYFFTDKNNWKIESILINKWIIFHKSDIIYFLNKYKWNFNDLNIIISHYNNKKNFSEILYLFAKECIITYKNNCGK